MEEVVGTLSGYISSGPDWPYALVQLYKGSSHTPLPKDPHLGILPQWKVEESSYGQISQLKVHQLLSARPQVVYPVDLNGDNKPITTTLLEPLSSGTSITINEHPYIRIDIPRPPLEESECTVLLTDKTCAISVTNSPKTSLQPRVSMPAEVNDLLIRVMAGASSCGSENSPIGRVATAETVASPPQKSEATPQPINTSSQGSMEDMEASLESPQPTSPPLLPPTVAEAPAPH